MTKLLLLALRFMASFYSRFFKSILEFVNTLTLVVSSF